MISKLPIGCSFSLRSGPPTLISCRLALQILEVSWSHLQPPLQRTGTIERGDHEQHETLSSLRRDYYEGAPGSPCLADPAARRRVQPHRHGRLSFIRTCSANGFGAETTSGSVRPDAGDRKRPVTDSATSRQPVGNPVHGQHHSFFFYNVPVFEQGADTGVPVAGQAGPGPCRAQRRGPAPDAAPLQPRRVRIPSGCACYLIDPNRPA